MTLIKIYAQWNRLSKCKQTMKMKFLPFLLSLLFTCEIASSQLNVGSSSSPNANAMLQVTSTNKGVLFPNVVLSATNNASPMSSFTGTSGMVVYNTATAGSGNSSVSPGFYYSNGSKWLPFTNSSTSTGIVASGTCFDDTTGTVLAYGANSTSYSTSSPTGYAYSGYGSTYGYQPGTYLPLAKSSNIDSVKKVGVGAYKVFITPGSTKDANYSVIAQAIDGNEVCNDNAWQSSILPYQSYTGSSAGTSAQNEGEPSVTHPGSATSTYYILKRQNYFYILSNYPASDYNSAQISFVVID